MAAPKKNELQRRGIFTNWKIWNRTSLVSKYQILPPIYPILAEIGDGGPEKNELQRRGIFTNWKIWNRMSLMSKYKNFRPFGPDLSGRGS